MESPEEQYDGPQAHPVQGLAVDAAVATAANLIYVATGPVACQSLGEMSVQVSLTPTVAHRISEVLRCILQYPDLETRVAIIEEWNAGEAPHMPHGSVSIDMQCVRIAIEPLGAGVYVPVLWEHVPALIMQLTQVARALFAASATSA